MKNVGLIGSATGKLGNTVFYTRKGVTCSRVYQPTVANPNTVRQKLARDRFRLAGQTARAFIQAAALGYSDQLVGGESPYNKMVADLLTGTAITGGVLSPIEVDRTKIQVSEGVVTQPPVSAVDAEVALQLSLSRATYRAAAAQAAADINVPVGQIGLVVVVYCPDYDACRVYQFEPESYNEDQLKMEMPSQWQGLRVSVYCFFKELLASGLDEITTAAIPWKYPSRASNTVSLGETDIN